MSSNAENKDVEVKKTKMRNRSRQKQNDVDDNSLPSNNDEIDVSKKKQKRHKKTNNTNGNDHSQSIETKRIKTDSTSMDEEKGDIDNEEGKSTNKKGKPSKRQQKREKAVLRETMKKEARKPETIRKALNYVSKWKHAKSEWKFEKLRQISLMDHLLDDSAIPDDIFPIVLEYFEGCKGVAREQLLKKCMDVIKKQEKDEEALTEEEKNSVAYKRARQLLQTLPTET